MSEVKLIVRDLDVALFGVVHGSVGDRVVAALSADPETIDELELAFVRFLRSDERDPEKCPDTEPRLRRWLTSHGDDEPYDAGLVVIDLAARLVVINSTYSAPENRGIVFDPSNQQKGGLRSLNYYHLADDWDFVYDLDVWRSLAESRRKKRASQPPMDVRSVLFGEPLLEFIVRHCSDVFQCPPDGPSESEQDPLTRESIALTLAMQHPEVERNYRAVEWYNELFSQLHEHWLLSPRCDLQHRSPRDVIVEKREHIDLDLQDRYRQWADLGRCPAPISIDSHAWRFAGLGTAEIVIYYDLVRFLLQKCWEDLELEAETAKTIRVPESFTRGEMAMLALARDEWLATPNPDYYEQAPHWFLQRERKRIPLAASNDEVLWVPMLIGLDGSDMDEGFAFDYCCLDLEQWEQEQARSNATAEKAAILEEVEEELGLPDLDFATLDDDSWTDAEDDWGDDSGDDSGGDLADDRGGDSDGEPGSEKAEWLETSSTARPQLTWLIDVGSDVAEVIVVLRGPGNRLQKFRSRQIQILMEQFANLRAAVSDSSEPVTSERWAPLKAEFKDALQRVAAEVPETVAACEAVLEQLNNPKVQSW